MIHYYDYGDVKTKIIMMIIMIMTMIVVIMMIMILNYDYHGDNHDSGDYSSNNCNYSDYDYPITG